MNTPHRQNDLTDDEVAHLDELLAQAPEPLQALDVSMLDGYLCGVLVQPERIAVDDWLPPVFDFDGQAVPEGFAPEWVAQVRALAERRMAAINRGLAEDGWFDPILPVGEMGEDAFEPSGDEREDAALRALPNHSRTLLPFVIGFQMACEQFPALDALEDESVAAAMARLYRHLPVLSDADRELLTLVDREAPLRDLDDASDDLVNAIADLYELTVAHRYRVETVRRDAPKTGRNDPCPCGSGKKYKQCHGAA